MSLAPAVPLAQTGQDSALQVLRDRTRGLHAQLEAAIDIESALNTLPRYVHLLRGYLNLYTAFDAELQRQEVCLHGILADLYQSRVPSLERDLLALGVDRTSLRVDSPAISLPSLGDHDSLLGALYVVEGSSLGGQVIYRQIQQTLGIDAASGAAFFFGNGDQTGAAWKRFTLLLNEHVSRPEQAAEAAAAMFLAFAHALQPSGNDGPIP